MKKDVLIAVLSPLSISGAEIATVVSLKRHSIIIAALNVI